ncbi:translation initiation factor IF-3 [Candidatus Margulisiibacteriota bacterium]
MKKNVKKYIVNNFIRAREVRLISENGEQLGVLTITDALAKAREADLDLLLISDTATPPVCKIVNLGQYKYLERKKKKENKKNVVAQTVKELKISAKISDHDFQVRINKAEEFLKKGYKVKLTLRFKGREVIHPDLGRKKIKKFIETVKEYGIEDSNVNFVNKLMTVMIRAK